MKIKMRDRRMRRSYFDDESLARPKQAVYTFFFDLERSAKDCRYGWMDKVQWAILMADFKAWFLPKTERWFPIVGVRGGRLRGARTLDLAPRVWP